MLLRLIKRAHPEVHKERLNLARTWKLTWSACQGRDMALRKAPVEMECEGRLCPLGVLSDCTSKDAVNLSPQGKALKMRKSPAVLQDPMITALHKESSCQKTEEDNCRRCQYF